ncbi:VOC family protein, partial [Enterococcus faecalis]|uniref:VOC family protein n=1 Tax=Enterococcus faecalis TaxID=1351 RepID=UPI003D6C24B3
EKKIDIKLGSQEMENINTDQFPARPSYPEAIGIRHLAFKVEHIEEVIAFINEQGIETESLRVDDFTGEIMTFFFDPDGL